MSVSLPEWAGRYVAIGIGLLLGEAAKYGLAITDNEKLSWRGLGADLLMLGLLGLVAALITDWARITDARTSAFVAAICALLGARLIRIIRDRATARAPGIIDRVIPDGIAGAQRLPLEPATPEQEALLDKLS